MIVVATALLQKDNRELFADMIPLEFDWEKKDDYMIGALSDEGYACGLLWYSFRFDHYEINYIGVHPVFRRQKIATILLDRFFANVYKSGYVLPVNIVFEDNAANFPFRLFLQEYGHFDISMEGIIYDLTPTKKTKLYNKEIVGKCRNRSICFFDNPGYLTKKFLLDLEEAGICFLEDFYKEQNLFVPELCRCVIKDDEIIAGCFFKQKDDDLELSFLYGKDYADKSIMYTIADAICIIIQNSQAYEKYNLHMSTTDVSVMRMIDFFYDDRADRTLISRAEWDYSL